MQKMGSKGIATPEATREQGWTAKGKRVYDEAGRLVARATSKEAARRIVGNQAAARRLTVVTCAWWNIEMMSATLAKTLGPRPRV